jgi:hypothetical protein
MRTTRLQREAIKRLYDRSADGAGSYLAFRRRFVDYSIGPMNMNNYIGAEWCGMFIGIETDGYTHS